MRRIIVVFLFLLVFCSHDSAKAQSPQKAMEILDEALGKYMEAKNFGIWLEGIAYDVKDPKSFFSLANNKILRGGYIYVKDDKYEINLGQYKMLSDGKLMVYVDEANMQMFVDSVRERSLSSETPDIDKLFMDEIGDGEIKYEGIEMMNGKKCHKISSEFKQSDNLKNYYWVDVDTKQLLLLAEGVNNVYTVYWMKKIGKSPANYSYKINLPKRELNDFAGYEVLDQRYTAIELSTPPNPKTRKK